MAFSSPRVSRRPAPIGPYFPYARVRAEAELALFSPRVGQLLRCSVHEVGPDFVAALAVGFVNVSIEASRVRPDFRPPAPGSGGVAWVSRRHPERRLEPGVEVLVRVVELKRQGAFLHVVASLEDEDTGRLVDLADERRDAKAATKEDDARTTTRKKKQQVVGEASGDKTIKEEKAAKHTQGEPSDAKAEATKSKRDRGQASKSKDKDKAAAKHDASVGKEKKKKNKTSKEEAATVSVKKEASTEGAQEPSRSHGSKRSRDGAKSDDVKDAEKKSKKKKSSSSSK